MRASSRQFANWSFLKVAAIKKELVNQDTLRLTSGCVMPCLITQIVKHYLGSEGFHLLSNEEVRLEQAAARPENASRIIRYSYGRETEFSWAVSYPALQNLIVLANESLRRSQPEKMSHSPSLGSWTWARRWAGWCAAWAAQSRGGFNCVWSLWRTLLGQATALKLVHAAGFDCRIGFFWVENCLGFSCFDCLMNCWQRLWAPWGSPPIDYYPKNFWVLYRPENVTVAWYRWKPCLSSKYGAGRPTDKRAHFALTFGHFGYPYEQPVQKCDLNFSSI